VGEEIKNKQIELIDFLGAASPGQNEIEKKQEEIQRLQGAVQDLVIAHFLRASSFLTPEQRARFLDLIKNRIGASGQAGPPWMRSFERGEPSERRN
jgi:Spy/CpxP family protein refolding chaperone